MKNTKVKVIVALLTATAIATIPFSQPLLAQSSGLNIRQEGRLNKGSHTTFEFQGEFNQYVTISVNSRQFDSYLELYDTDGRLLAENDNANSRNAQIRVNLPTTGIYTVVVRGARNSERGNYTLAIEDYRGQTGQTPNRPEIREWGRVGQGQIKYHTFSGQAGQTITIVAESYDFDPLMVVTDPDDFAVASNNPNENRVQFRLSKTGTYRVAVQGLIQGNGSFRAGEYTLVINRS